MKNFHFLLFISLIGVIIFLAFTPWRMTLKTLNFLLSILPIEETELSKDVIREIHQKDPQTAFYIFRSTDEKKHPGAVFSLGLHPEGAEDKRVQKIFQGLVRNGITIITVDSAHLKNSFIDPKEIENLAEAFQFLERQPYIDSNTIGFFGLSVGSSLAFLAAADPEIRDKVKYIVWMGGYFDAKELILDILSQSFVFDGEIQSWDPSLRIQEAIKKNIEEFSQEETDKNRQIVENILGTTDRTQLEKIFQELPSHTEKILQSISPKTEVSNVKAPLFILHGKEDHLIPFSHSVNLFEIYPGKKQILLSDKYGHTAPEKPSFKDLFQKNFWQALSFSNKLLTEIF